MILLALTIFAILFSVQGSGSTPEQIHLSATGNLIREGREKGAFPMHYVTVRLVMGIERFPDSSLNHCASTSEH